MIGLRRKTDPSPGELASLPHVPQLDGLRAVAVMAVVVFHNNERLLPGGFIGVDLFFVLSGYLITRLLIVEHRSTGKLSLSTFYARRLRRLLPASLAVLLAVIGWTAVAGAPSALVPTRGDIVATLAYVANWRFVATDVDYFGLAGTVSPLRHFWSLAVEEQFYVLWPVLVAVVLGARRSRNNQRLLLGVTAALAVASAVWIAAVFDPVAPTRAYFGTDTRAHQMLIGALAGMVQARGMVSLGRCRAWAQVGALGALGAFMLLLDGSDAAYFRGGSVAVAMVAALLIVATVEEGAGPVDRALSWRPVLGLGAISYAVYLWHWPVIRWLPYGDGAPFLERRMVDLGRFVITIALATASFRLFENAIRRGGLPWVRTVTWRTLVVALLASLTVLGVAVALLTPSSDDEAAFAATDQSVVYCPDQPRPCAFHTAGADRPVVVSMGDSSSQQYTPALVELAKEHDFTYVQAGLGGCGFDGRRLAKGTGSGDQSFVPTDIRCADSWRGIMDHVVRLKPDLVLVSDRQLRGPSLSRDGVRLERGSEAHVAAVAAAQRSAANELTAVGATVVLVDPLPRLPDVDCLAQHSAQPGRCDKPADLSEFRPYLRGWDLLAAASGGEVRRLSLLREVCPDGSTCPAVLDAIVASYDGTHLTRSMSQRLSSAFDRLLRQQGVDLAALG